MNATINITKQDPGIRQRARAAAAERRVVEREARAKAARVRLDDAALLVQLVTQTPADRVTGVADDGQTVTVKAEDLTFAVRGRSMALEAPCWRPTCSGQTLLWLATLAAVGDALARPVECDLHSSGAAGHPSAGGFPR
jgi:hypothetical protein